MATAPGPIDEWKTIPWTQCERAVFKLQKRIFQASARGDQKTVHHLQRLLLRSRAARFLAVRRVTQDNRGKRTAGVDGVKSLRPPQRLRLARTLRLSNRTSPTRRVRIPKPGSDELRPLGIPTMGDRAAQALAKLALEPEWEAKFEPHSFGFRPGRSAHDAIEALFGAICRQPKYVLDADITKCFDRIDHSALLARLDTFPALRRAVRAWLTAGVLDGPTLFPTAAGTPQGVVVSPLLANIALRAIVQRDCALSQPALIAHLAPVIRGWTQYYRTGASKTSFAKLDFLTYQLLRRWAIRRHRNKSAMWIAHKYWRRDRGTWDFAPPTGPKLPRHNATAIQRHRQVQGSRTPFDGDWVYWGVRLGRRPDIPRRTAVLLNRQRGICPRCGLSFRHGDLLEIDHLAPTAPGGPRAFHNWQLLHGHCHVLKLVAAS